MAFLKKSQDRMFELGNMVSVVGPEAYFQGTINAKGSLRIDGRMEGSITEAHAVVIGETGKVVGDIAAESAVVGGEVKGNISAARSAELLATSRVSGDIRTGRIVIEEGAFFEGHCSMMKEEEAAAEPERASGDERP
ncbi:MAG: polymer-forming cytoskeletal protein [Elusimicrobiales bacterium]